VELIAGFFIVEELAPLQILDQVQHQLLLVIEVRRQIPLAVIDVEVKMQA
jgi:hypothetical protein